MASTQPPRNLTVLWSFFHPPSPASLLSISSLPTSSTKALLLCASSSCLRAAQGINFPTQQLVLPPLCKGTPLEPFILHHAFYKTVLEKQFPDVLQLVASLCILYKGPGVLVNPSMRADFSKLLLEPSVAATRTRLIFSPHREVVYGVTCVEKCPKIKSLMKEVMDSLDTLPDASANTTTVVGTSRLEQIPTFLSFDFEIMEIQRISDVNVEEDPGCIHYDTFQTDCRRKRKGKADDRDCIVNAGNEMQVKTKKPPILSLLIIVVLRALQAFNTHHISPPGWTIQISQAMCLPLLTHQPWHLATPGGVEPMEPSPSHRPRL